MSVILTNHDLDEVLQNRLTEEEKVRYNLYNLTFGNRNYLFDLNNLPAYGRGSSDYTIPPEALPSGVRYCSVSCSESLFSGSFRTAMPST